MAGWDLQDALPLDWGCMGCHPLPSSEVPAFPETLRICIGDFLRRLMLLEVLRPLKLCCFARGCG